MAYQYFERLFNGGIDTKADPRVLTGKLLDLKNGVFTRYGNVRKRNGYTRLPSAETTGRALYARGNELLLSDGEALLTYAEGQQAWVDRGPFHQLALSTQVVSKTSASAQRHADRAEHGGITVRAWEASGSVVFTVTDTETGAVLAHEQAIANSALPVVRRIGNAVHIAYWDEAASELRALVVRPAALAVSLATAPITLAADARVGAVPPAFDIDSREGEAVIVYTSTTANTFRLGRLKESGGYEGTVFSVDAGDTINALAVAWGFDVAQLVVVTTDTETTGYEFELDTGSMEFSQTHTETLGDPAIRVAVAAGSGGWWAWWEIDGIGLSPGDGNKNNYVQSRPWSLSAGAGTPTVEQRHSAIASRGWGVGAHAFVHVCHESALQSTYFALRGAGTGTDGTTPVLVARALSGTATGTSTTLSYADEQARTLPGVDLCGDGLYRVALGYKERLDTQAIASTTGSGIPDQLTPVYTEPGVVELAYDFAAKAASAQVGNSLYLAAGYKAQYDGVSVVEQNTHLYPEGVRIEQDVGGDMEAGVRAYRWYVGWVNDQGERELSSFATEVQITMLANGKAEVTIPTISHTAKRGDRGNLFFVGFRSAADPFDTSPFHQVTSLDPGATGDNGFVFNDPDVDAVVFIDNMTDVDLVSQRLDPANANELDGLPGYGSVIASGQDRIYVAGLDDPNKVLYSKLHFAGQSVAFNEALTIQVDEEGGPITGLRVLNETLLIFKERAVYYVTGAGLDNLGQGGGYSEASLLAADVGSINQASIVAGPDGVYFQSAKGIHLVNGSGAVYVGAPVEAYNGVPITAATLLADVNQIRFLTNGERTLVYDYFFKQWSTFTNHAGVDAVLWRDAYTYVTAAGDVMVEAADVWTDAGTPVRLTIETDWIKLAGLQGFQQVRRMGILGEFRTPHRLRISYAYNYENGWPHSYEWDPASVINQSVYGTGDYGDETPYGGAGSSVYQGLHGLRHQKCQSVRFKFEDVAASSPGAAFILTGLALEVMVNGGIHRQGQARLIGSAASSKYEGS